MTSVLSHAQQTEIFATLKFFAAARAILTMCATTCTAMEQQSRLKDAAAFAVAQGTLASVIALSSRDILLEIFSKIDALHAAEKLSHPVLSAQLKSARLGILEMQSKVEAHVLEVTQSVQTHKQDPAKIQNITLLSKELILTKKQFLLDAVLELLGAKAARLQSSFSLTMAGFSLATLASANNRITCRHNLLQPESSAFQIIGFKFHENRLYCSQKKDSSCLQGMITVWNLNTCPPVKEAQFGILGHASGQCGRIAVVGATFFFSCHDVVEVWDISKLPSTPSFLTSLELPSGKTISIKSDCSDAISADETRLAVLLSDQQTIRLWDNSVSPPQFRCDMSAGFLTNICCVCVTQSMLFIVGIEGFAVYNTHPSTPINAGYHIPVDKPYTNLLQNADSGIVSATVQSGHLDIFMKDQTYYSGQSQTAKVSTIYRVNMSEPPFKANSLAMFSHQEASQFPFVRCSNALVAESQPIIFTYFPSPTKPDVYVDEIGKVTQQHALDDTAFKYMHSCCTGNQGPHLLGFVAGTHCLVCICKNGICTFD
jgi:hypothetical protein